LRRIRMRWPSFICGHRCCWTRCARNRWRRCQPCGVSPVQSQRVLTGHRIDLLFDRPLRGQYVLAEIGRNGPRNALVLPSLMVTCRRLNVVWGASAIIARMSAMSPAQSMAVRSCINLS
jgi:hypothetical protein